jgi:glycosyltransferase involved in cell wall biosynthesis
MSKALGGLDNTLRNNLGQPKRCFDETFMTALDDIRAALPQTFVIVRAYNEGAVIGDVIGDLLNVFPNIIVVDDGSTDETQDLLRRLPVRLITHHVNLGAGAAMQTGFTYALQYPANYLLTFDADGQHRVEDAVAVLRELVHGTCDVVYGSRFLGHAAVNMPFVRKLVLRMAITFANITTGTRFTDAHNGLCGFTRKAALIMDLSQNGMAYASEITAQLTRHRMRIHEVPVQIIYTDYSLRKGQSSLNAINVVVDLLVGRLLK